MLSKFQGRGFRLAYRSFPGVLLFDLCNSSWSHPHLTLSCKSFNVVRLAYICRISTVFQHLLKHFPWVFKHQYCRFTLYHMVSIIENFSSLGIRLVTFSVMARAWSKVYDMWVEGGKDRRCDFYESLLLWGCYKAFFIHVQTWGRCKFIPFAVFLDVKFFLLRFLRLLRVWSFEHPIFPRKCTR